MLVITNLRDERLALLKEVTNSPTYHPSSFYARRNL
jgi:Zn/Cd-binding protein ZinT